jgi:hypothetical protein
MKILRTILFVVCTFAAVGMFYSVFAFTPGNPVITDSITDKILWAVLLAGCGGGYAVAAYSLLKGSMDLVPSFVKTYGMVSIFMFIIGLYYHTMFGSPL